MSRLSYALPSTASSRLAVAGLLGDGSLAGGLGDDLLNDDLLNKDSLFELGVVDFGVDPAEGQELVVCTDFD